MSKEPADSLELSPEQMRELMDEALEEACARTMIYRLEGQCSERQRRAALKKLIQNLKPYTSNPRKQNSP